MSPLAISVSYNGQAFLCLLSDLGAIPVLTILVLKV